MGSGHPPVPSHLPLGQRPMPPLLGGLPGSPASALSGNPGTYSSCPEKSFSSSQPGTVSVDSANAFPDTHFSASWVQPQCPHREPPTPHSHLPISVAPGPGDNLSIGSPFPL